KARAGSTAAEKEKERQIVSLGGPEFVRSLRTLVDAAIARDTNSLVAAMLTIAERVVESNSQKNGDRALRLIAGILQYAETFTKNDEIGDGHNQRKKLLESLTREMTD